MSEAPPGDAARSSDRHLPHPPLLDYYADHDGRREYLRQSFDRSARHYDRINWFMSFGTDKWYRRQALLRAGLAEGMTVLDVGCGTGMISEPAGKIVGDAGRVVGVDPSLGMLGEAITRSRLSLPINGRGEWLPLPDESFDFLCMSYALRHVDDLEGTFVEYRRVLKPGGRVLLLEMTPPPRGLLFHTLKFWMRTVVPVVTRVMTDRDAQSLYAYCWDTFEQCVPPDAILEALEGAGFRGVSRHLEARIFSEYTATR